jgi:hypothetical protein
MLRTLQFNRNEFAGAFGDIGTDLPLIVAIILATGLPTAGVLIVFGLAQIASGLYYRMPMAVQPLKAMATIVIAQQVGGPVLLGGGLAIGAIMLVLSATGLLSKLAKLVAKYVVRAIQFGLGLKLSVLALFKYIPSMGETGYFLALGALLLGIVLIKNKTFPAALAMIGFGVAASFWRGFEPGVFIDSFEVHLPHWQAFGVTEIIQGFVLLALPQIPLSLGNSIIATHQVAADLFPDREPPSIQRIGFSYAVMNLIAPLFGGIPCCHGSGGMAGHYTFGGRTGGSVIIYGSMFALLGLFFSNGLSEIIELFPLPILGVILLFEGGVMMRFISDQFKVKREFIAALLLGLIAAFAPYGFVIALIGGIGFDLLSARLGRS